MKYLIVFLFISGTIYGQNILDIPSSPEFSNYLHARQDSIEKKLYRLALTGKIKPYRTDSFASVYGATEFKERGGMEKRMDFDHYIIIKSDSSRSPFSPKNIDGIWFVENVRSGKDLISINTFKGIALIYQPVFDGIKTSPIPLCWIRTADLLKSLPHRDLEFLLQLFYYGRNSNHVRELPEKDVYYHLNMTGERTIMADSPLLGKIAGMLTYSQFYVEEQLYITKGLNPIGNRIFDEQSQKTITLDTFEKHYMQEVAIFIQTNPDDPTIGRDSVLYMPIQLKTLYAVSYDHMTKQLTNYHTRIYQPGIKRQEVSTFSIPVNRNYLPVKSIIWFYEDYIRWRGL